jgi:YfiH family protein
MNPGARWEESGGLQVVRMEALESLGGVAALFTGRRGGASARWQGGLNWAYSVDDDPEAVRVNRQRTLDLIGLPLERAVIAGLVHGDRIAAVSGEEPPGRDGVRWVPECDGLITDRPGLALVVTAADCVPVYLYDPVRRAVGAVHAGWRGTVARIAGKAVRAMAEAYGCRPADIHAAIGPSIGPCCFEVDEPVAGPVREAFGDGAGRLLLPGRAPGKWMLDLWAANRLDLEEAGVRQVAVAGACTACGVDRLFSHRRERGQAGRGAAVIALMP